jgi:hypothetical protein
VAPVRGRGRLMPGTLKLKPGGSAVRIGRSWCSILEGLRRNRLRRSLGCTVVPTALSMSYLPMARPKYSQLASRLHVSAARPFGVPGQAIGGVAKSARIVQEQPFNART